MEDHYYDKKDAAVVFQYRRIMDNGQERYIYHGNDGTSMPWNDTAQLNYLILMFVRQLFRRLLRLQKIPSHPF